MADQMKILLKTEQKPEAVAVLQFLEEMTPAEQQEFLVFMQGVRFAKGLERKKLPQQPSPYKSGGGSGGNSRKIQCTTLL